MIKFSFEVNLLKSFAEFWAYLIDRWLQISPLLHSVGDSYPYANCKFNLAKIKRRRFILNITVEIGQLSFQTYKFKRLFAKNRNKYYLDHYFWLKNNISRAHPGDLLWIFDQKKLEASGVLFCNGLTSTITSTSL
jgi:hypothetical protein